MSRLVVKCPTCGKPVSWDENAKWRPFCSDRCRLIDLGEWASESHRIPGDRKLPDEFIDEQTDPDEDKD
ncbi:DNA gyrase inhibitor YacG [Thiohalophilus sp.]|uniref:DNA gyrase inhibitor YacG n=1 Tax=Thiohalophilus sp. TaxID=3028392 RepID=UPI002ACDE96E|nr:DNA gyrase inhibitor YacG [Thiohalophilus sp.]MDZ7662329.1 DNA gyrase inhibitor YacG [Thiohalophilus sp.]MDZ7802412.1 DNA gyrase inhibitor YacG [Thiohalophilus sp.]